MQDKPSADVDNNEESFASFYRTQQLAIETQKLENLRKLKFDAKQLKFPIVISNIYPSPKRGRSIRPRRCKSHTNARTTTKPASPNIRNPTKAEMCKTNAQWTSTSNSPKRQASTGLRKDNQVPSSPKKFIKTRINILEQLVRSPLNANAVKKERRSIPDLILDRTEEIKDTKAKISPKRQSERLDIKPNTHRKLVPSAETYEKIYTIYKNPPRVLLQRKSSSPNVFRRTFNSPLKLDMKLI